MNLPPIIANLPFMKIFRADQAGKSNAQSALSVKKTSQPQDTITISDAAQNRLKATEAGAVAVQTKDQLASSHLSLGLDPKFT